MLEVCHRSEAGEKQREREREREREKGRERDRQRYYIHASRRDRQGHIGHVRQDETATALLPEGRTAVET